jgi:hypothetical protein
MLFSTGYNALLRILLDLKMFSQLLRKKGFYRIIDNEESCLEYLKHKGLVCANPRGLCEKFRNGAFCGVQVRKVEKKGKNGKTQFCLRCPKRGCQSTVSIRIQNGYFTFTDLNGRCSSRRTLYKIMGLVWLWLQFVKNITAAKHTKKSSHTVCDWYNLCRYLCIRMFEPRKTMGGTWRNRTNR